MPWIICHAYIVNTILLSILVLESTWEDHLAAINDFSRVKASRDIFCDSCIQPPYERADVVSSGLRRLLTIVTFKTLSGVDENQK